jgi:hypothetical protein
MDVLLFHGYYHHAMKLADSCPGSSWHHVAKVKPDSDYQNGFPLWRAFRECEERTKKKQSGMKGKAFAHHALPDGRTFVYSKKLREQIPQHVLDRIRCVPADA